MVVDVWIGTFPSQDALLAYVADDDDGESPLSRFAADQAQSFYDTDFLVAAFSELTSDLGVLLEDTPGAGAFLDAAGAAHRRLGGAPVNAAILVYGHQIHAPRDGALFYLGQFTD